VELAAPRVYPASTRLGVGLRTAVACVVLPLLIGIVSPVGILLALLGARAEVVHPLYVFFARAALRVGGTQVEVRGQEHVDPGSAYVVVCNHESVWDPLCLLAALRGLLLRFVIKESAMRTPLLGHALRATGNVSVRRTDTPVDVDRIERAMARRDPALSMVFFAEGTRSRDGALHAFKKGPFATAIRHRLPVLPIGIAGTYRVWPKGTLGLRPGAVVIEVGEPIRADGAEGDRSALRDRCFGAVRELRAKARARLRTQGTEPGGVD
jgi:1-acyl-sn-glycerol-3-phosphate acyltransferase